MKLSEKIEKLLKKVALEYDDDCPALYIEYNKINKIWDVGIVHSLPCDAEILWDRVNISIIKSIKDLEKDLNKDIKSATVYIKK